MRVLNQCHFSKQITSVRIKHFKSFDILWLDALTARLNMLVENVKSFDQFICVSLSVSVCVYFNSGNFFCSVRAGGDCVAKLHTAKKIVHYVNWANFDFPLSTFDLD